MNENTLQNLDNLIKSKTKGKPSDALIFRGYSLKYYVGLFF